MRPELVSAPGMAAVPASPARRFVPRLAAALMLATGVTAATPAAALGVAEYLALVERHSPELAAAREQRVLAGAEATTARAYPNPELELGTGPWRSRVGGGSGSATQVAITQPIDLPSVRGPRIGAAEAGVTAARAAEQSSRLSIGYLARQAHAEWLRRIEDERSARDNAAVLAQIRDRVAVRVAVGEAPRFELVRAEAEALAAQNALAAARLRVDEARGAMRRLAGNEIPVRFEPTGPAPAPAEPLQPLAALQAEVLAAHPALKAFEAERERARRRLEQERALRGPQPSLRLADSRDPEMRATSVGVAITVPLWNRREGPIAQAQAGIDLAAAHLERERVNLLRELDSAHARFGIAQRQVQTFEAGLLKSAEAALQAAEAAYRFGERSFLEVLDAQRTLRTVRTDYHQARFDRLSAWLDLERLRARDPFAVSAGDLP